MKPSPVPLSFGSNKEDDMKLFGFPELSDFGGGGVLQILNLGLLLVVACLSKDEVSVPKTERKHTT